MKTKSELRQIFRARLGPSTGQSECADAYATENLNRNLDRRLKGASGIWAAFQPSGFEPDIRPALANAKSVTWAFPRVVGETLEFYIPQASDALVANRWGILEPDMARSRRALALDLAGLLVPGLVFDQKLNRLGRGRGYYDRALAELRLSNPRIIAIGVAFQAQVSEETLPAESFDQPMDWLITDQGEWSRLERKTS